MFWSSVDVAKVFATVLVPLAAVAHSTTTPSLGGIIAFLLLWFWFSGDCMQGFGDTFLDDFCVFWGSGRGGRVPPAGPLLEVKLWRRTRRQQKGGFWYAFRWIWGSILGAPGTVLPIFSETVFR